MALIVTYILCIALTVPLTSAQFQVVSLFRQWLNVVSEMTPDLNSSCVAEGCPELKSPSLCPGINDTATIVTIINTANRCMTKPMCGFVIDPIVIPETTFNYEGIPLLGKIGECSFLPGGTFANASHARVTDVSRTQNQVHIGISMPNLALSGRTSCTGGPINLSYTGSNAYNFTIIYNGKDVRVENPKFIINNFVYHIQSPEGNSTLSITQFGPIVIFLEEALLVAILSPFVTNIYQSVLEVASQNCPK